MADHKSDLAQSLRELAQHLQKMGRPSDARQALRDAVVHQNAAVRQAPEQGAYRQWLCIHYLELGEALITEKDHAGTAKAMADLLLEAPPGWPNYPAAALLLARCVPLAAKDNGLIEEKRKELARTYADRTMDLLNKAKAAGFKDAQTLQKASEFEVLRDRADFKRLLKEMSEKP